MQIRSVRWSELVPWSLLVVVLSCGGATIAPVVAPTPTQTSFKTIEAEEIVLRGKDGKVRGKLTGESLSLSDVAGNKVEISLGESARVAMTSAKGEVMIVLTATAKGGSIGVASTGKLAMLNVQEDSSDMTLIANGRRIAAGVEADRPLADLEFFDANEKRRASFGLNSNGDPRLSLYDANEQRRLYGILTEDVSMLDLNDKTGTPALELFGADPNRGSGMSTVHKTRTTNVGLGPDGKPLK